MDYGLLKVAYLVSVGARHFVNKILYTLQPKIYRDQNIKIFLKWKVKCFDLRKFLAAKWMKFWVWSFQHQLKWDKATFNLNKLTFIT